jgi:hypothetical protein
MLEVDGAPDAAAVNTNEETLVRTEPPAVAAVETMVFAVCGYHGFDSTANVKPTLGARLLEISKEPVNPSWSVQELEAALVDQGKLKGKSTSLTIHNDGGTRNKKTHFIWR